jgi:hypothetical protein
MAVERGAILRDAAQKRGPQDDGVLEETLLKMLAWQLIV